MRALAIGAAVVAFLAVSAAVARVLGAATAARGEVTDEIQRRGGGGEVDILRVDGISSFAVTDRTETVRVAWKAPGRLAVVQCVRIRRTGDPIVGYETAVVAVSPPIDREADCP